MKKILLSISLLTSVLSIAQAPEVVWAKTNGSTTFDIMRAIATDNTGNTITVGDFTETADLDPSSLTQNFTSQGSSDIAIRKLNADGEVVWIKVIGGLYGENGHDIAADNIGNIFVTGTFRGEVDFDPSTSTFNVGNSLNTSAQAFVLKLNSDGELVWVVSFGSESSAQGLEIDSDALGNLVVTGTFKGTADFDPGSGVYNLDSNPANPSNLGTYIVKLNVNGEFVWGGTIGGESGNNRPNDINFDPFGKVLITGTFGGTTDLDPTDAGTQMANSVGSDDIYVIKLNSDGSLFWAYSFGGSWGDYGNAIIGDDWGNVYVTGQFRQTVDFDPGTGTDFLIAGTAVNTFLQKFDSNGNYIWTKHLTGGQVEALDMIIDWSNNLYLTGYYQNTVDFDPSVDVTSHISNNTSQDVFVAKYDSDGNYQWSTTHGSPNEDYGYGIAMWDDGSTVEVYTAGYFRETIDFTPLTNNYSLTSMGEADQFIFKLGTCTLNNGITQNGMSLESYEDPTKTTFQWIDCDTDLPIAGEIDYNYTPTVNGSYAVIVSREACTDTSSCITIADVSVNELEKNQISIYPNPTSSSIQISSTGIIDKIFITSITGEIVMTTSLTEINLSDLKSGVYFLTVVSNNQQTTQKIIKQ